MYMRVTRSRTDPSKGDEARKLAQDLAAAAKRLPGCQSVTLGVDKATGQGIAVSTWDTEEHARWSRDALGGDILSRIQALGTQMDPSEFFEVTTPT